MKELAEQLSQPSRRSVDYWLPCALPGQKSCETLNPSASKDTSVILAIVIKLGYHLKLGYSFETNID